MMERPLDEIYLEWLYDQAVPPEMPPKRTYWRLFKQMLDTEFIWLVMNDDNRAADGKELRTDFARDTGVIIDNKQWLDLGCSFLEMMVALSRRLEFTTDRPANEWFWILMGHIKLTPYSDAMHWDDGKVDRIISQVIWRTYGPTGQGGLFPLRKAQQDQRKMELWHQMSAYLLERVGEV